LYLFTCKKQKFYYYYHKATNFMVNTPQRF